MAGLAPVRDLVRPDSVHRDAYISSELFEAERDRFFAVTWNFVAHASQIPSAGDYVTLELAVRPLLVLRGADGAIGVFYNRCAHKGTRLFSSPAGHAGKFLRCAYHAWTYRLDGSSLGVPMKPEYAASGWQDSPAARGLARVPGVAVYRDFIFVRLAEEGPDFEAYFGPALQWLDNMADRSPEGRLVVDGGIVRSTIRCNWKVYLENINDVVHAVSTHESAGKAAKAVWSAQPAQEAMPMAIEQLLPFASGYDYFQRMDAEVYPNGHSALGARFSTHSGYRQPEGYEEALVAAHGAERARQVLETSPQNAVLYPSIAVKGAPLVMRVVRPLAADLTEIQAWSLRAVGAPDLLFERALSYNRLVFSPMSIVAHDDIHLFEGIQQGLRSQGNEWVSLHRGFVPGEQEADDTLPCAGTNERLMRNQFHAWAQHMDARGGLE